MNLWNRVCSKSILVLAALIAFAAVAFGATSLADYHSRIRRAIELLDNSSEKAFETKSKESLKALLPEHETIVNEGEAIEADNKWISDEVAEMSGHITQADKDKAYDILIKKLKLLEADVTKLEQTNTRPDNQDQDKMKEILSRHEFAVKRGESLGTRFLNWLIEKLQKVFSFVPQRGPGFNKVLRVI